MNRADAYRRVAQLHDDLSRGLPKGADRDVSVGVVPVMKSVLDAAVATIPSDPVVKAVDALITPEVVEGRASLSAADALVVLGQLKAALFEPPRARAVSLRR